MANETMLEGERAEQYRALRKTGRCADGNERGRGSLYHAVNRTTMRSLCGSNPGRLSAGWSETDGDAVTCPRCLVTLNRVREKRTPTQRSWDRMKQRCNDPKRTEYPRYGGRGIKVCPRWNESFEAFRDDIGERPAGTSLDRYPNPDGDYEPGNCRWATPKEQRNNRSKDPFAQVRHEPSPDL